MSRRLACGDVEGRLEALFGRVRAIQGKSGRFDVRFRGGRGGTTGRGVPRSAPCGAPGEGEWGCSAWGSRSRPAGEQGRWVGSGQEPGRGDAGEVPGWVSRGGAVLGVLGPVLLAGAALVALGP